MAIENVASLFDRVPHELWIITAAHDNRRGGLVATFVSPASIVPEMPRIVIGISKRHKTWGLIEASNVFAVHLIDESQLELVWRFGLQSSRDTDKFDGLRTRESSTGSPVLADALAWLECRVETRLDIGDRTIYLAEVLDGESKGDGRPLTTARMAELGPPNRLALLRSQMADDAQHDTEAIHHWRANR